MMFRVANPFLFRNKLTQALVISAQPSRNAYVFKKTRFPKKLLLKVKKEDANQEHLNFIAKRGREFEDIVAKEPFEELLTYQVQEEEQPPHHVKVILVKNTEDYGKKGQIVTVDDPLKVKKDLLLPGLAVYATKENLEKYKDITIPEENLKFSSEYIKNWLPDLARTVLPVTMSLNNEWTLAPFHIRACFQRIRIEVPENCIEMPPRKIKGPNLENQNKEFYIHIQINNFERVPIRCVLNHRGNDPVENENLKTVGWQHRFHEPIFEEDREFLKMMRRTFVGPIAAEQEDFGPDMEKYLDWKKTRYQDIQNDDPK